MNFIYEGFHGAVHELECYHKSTQRQEQGCPKRRRPLDSTIDNNRKKRRRLNTNALLAAKRRCEAPQGKTKSMVKRSSLMRRTHNFSVAQRRAGENL